MNLRRRLPFLATRWFPFAARWALLAARRALVAARWALLAARRALVAARWALLAARRALVAARSPLLTARWAVLAARELLLERPRLFARSWRPREQLDARLERRRLVPMQSRCICERPASAQTVSKRLVPNGQKKKARMRMHSGSLGIIPAASYSPTRLPVQYHRLRRA